MNRKHVAFWRWKRGEKNLSRERNTRNQTREEKFKFSDNDFVLLFISSYFPYCLVCLSVCIALYLSYYMNFPSHISLNWAITYLSKKKKHTHTHTHTHVTQYLHFSSLSLSSLIVFFSSSRFFFWVWRAQWGQSISNVCLWHSLSPPSLFHLSPLCYHIRLYFLSLSLSISLFLSLSLYCQCKVLYMTK